MIIDAWMQHPKADWIGNPMFESLRRWRPGKWSETAPPIQDTLAEMDRAGVSVGMLCAWHGPSGPMISNDEVAQYCRVYPDRFIGIASVDLFRPMEAVRGWARVRDGFKGLRFAWVWGLPPDDRHTYPLFAECCEQRSICTPVGHAGPLRKSEPGRPIPYLDRVALEFPELPARWPYWRFFIDLRRLTRSAAILTCRVYAAIGHRVSSDLITPSGQRVNVSPDLIV
jgi:predicted TIM-barrel fold metal-dependent hydrolase